MTDITKCDFVYVAGYNDNAMGELVRSEKHYVDLPYAFTVALELLNRCDHALIFGDNEEIPLVMSTLSIVPKGTIIINRKE